MEKRGFNIGWSDKNPLPFVCGIPPCLPRLPPPRLPFVHNSQQIRLSISYNCDSFHAQQRHCSQSVHLGSSAHISPLRLWRRFRTGVSILLFILSISRQAFVIVFVCVVSHAASPTTLCLFCFDFQSLFAAHVDTVVRNCVSFSLACRAHLDSRGGTIHSVSWTAAKAAAP